MGSKPLVRPLRLARGSRIALVAPAGPLLERDDLTRADALCRALDYEPVLGTHAGGHYGYGVVGDPLTSDTGQCLLQLREAAEITEGFSGAPVVDRHSGLVVGMVDAVAPPDPAIGLHKPVTPGPVGTSRSQVGT